MEREMMSKKVKFSRKTYKLVNANSLTNHFMISGRNYTDITCSVVEEAIRCDECGTYHMVKESDAIKFFSLYGNLHANDMGGLLGNGSWDDHGVPVYHFCPECLISYIKEQVRKSKPTEVDESQYR